MASFRARPYARALFDVLDDVDKAEALLPQLESLGMLTQELPQFRVAMESPALNPEKKAEILNAILDHMGIKEPLRRFAHVVQQHFRWKYAPEIARTFRDLINRARGRQDARIELASPVNAQVRQELVGALEKIIGTEIVAEFVETKELLAGFRIQVASKLFDGSVDGQLKQLSRKAQQV